MKSPWKRAVAVAMCLMMTGPGQVAAQLAPAAPPPPASQPAQPIFSQQELDQMLAPIALYPDPLLAQILMAATYPLEVVQAARWVERNRNLKGEPLARAIEPKTWDPSVKSLVPFPMVLKTMNENLEWTERLGEAFIAQEQDVMDSVQRLRRQAEAAGHLRSDQHQRVLVQEEAIVIEPARAEVVYVPAYNPTVVYGAWPYPAYPPVYYPPPPGYGYAPLVVAGLGFGLGVLVVGSLWNWGRPHWRNRYIYVDTPRYNRIHVHRPPIVVDRWHHDPYHRRGVVYRTPHLHQHYGRPAIQPEPRREARVPPPVQSRIQPDRTPRTPHLTQPGRPGERRLHEPGQLPTARTSRPPQAGEPSRPTERRFRDPTPPRYPEARTSRPPQVVQPGRAQERAPRELSQPRQPTARMDRPAIESRRPPEVQRQHVPQQSQQARPAQASRQPPPQDSRRQLEKGQAR